MMIFHGIECTTPDDLLPKNKEGLSQDTDNPVSNLETERSSEGVAGDISNKIVNEDDFDYELGVSEEEQEFRFREAIRLAKEKSRIMGKTTCEYDREKGKPYLLHPDGRKEYPTLD